MDVKHDRKTESIHQHSKTVPTRYAHKLYSKNIIDNDPAVKQGLLILHLTEFNTFLSK